jgi:hypothetical protein
MAARCELESLFAKLMEVEIACAATKTDTDLRMHEDERRALAAALTRIFKSFEAGGWLMPDNRFTMSGALDRYITGNYGEDQFRNICCVKCEAELPEDATECPKCQTPIEACEEDDRPERSTFP